MIPLSNYILEKKNDYLLYTVKVSEYKDELRIDVTHHYFDNHDYAFMSDIGRVHSYSDNAAKFVDGVLIDMEKNIKGFDSRELDVKTYYVYSDNPHSKNWILTDKYIK
jgi:hypothetical protein